MNLCILCIIFDSSLQECHTQLLRHRNSYLHQVKHIIKSGGPWENPVLQKILKEADLQPNEGEFVTCDNSKRM